MNRTFTSLRISRQASFFALAAILVCTLLAISATNIAAQSSVSASVTEMVPAGDLPQVVGTTWKAPADYSTVLATERANTALILAAANQKDSKVALYNGYDRLLSYMQVDMAANVPIEKIAAKNFTKVTLETPADPMLNNMQTEEFNALYNALIGMLVQ